MRVLVLIAGLIWLAGCGVDGPPVPPGQDNPRTIDTADDFDPDRLF